MTIKFKVKDNLSKYFDELLGAFSDNEEHILKEMMYSATGYPHDRNAPISKRLMEEGRKGKKKYEYNPYLFESGQDSSLWTIDIGNEESKVRANYSGMRGYLEKDEFMVWVEFSDEFIEALGKYGDWGTAFNIVRNMNPFDRTLNRDYAFYQETGADKYASPESADHIGYVSKGMGEAAKDKIPRTLARQTDILLSKLSK